jgi:hypothetical protein
VGWIKKLQTRERMSAAKQCLNCNARLEDDFCKHCGQAASTHRFTLRHVVAHDLMHAIFHFGGGFFHTIKELSTRPGHSIREYVAGKRVKHLNYLSFMIVIILLFSGAEAITNFDYGAPTRDATTQLVEDTINDNLKHHPKIVFITLLPLLALTTLLMFRKAKQNLAEHFVLNTYKQGAILLVNVFFVLLASRIATQENRAIAERILSVLSGAYGIWFYYQYFSPFYTRKGLLLVRVIAATLIPTVIVTIVLTLYFGLPVR